MSLWLVKTRFVCYTSGRMKIIFIADIVGKIGRRALAEVLPEWKQKYNPDLVIANVENIAHGVGVTASALEEVRKAGAEFFTTGNHWADKSDGLALFSRKDVPIIRPANWPGNVPGAGHRVIEVGSTKVAIINLQGQVFLKQNCASPFFVLDAVLKAIGPKVKIKIVDFQAEATSEKQALGYYSDGRVSAVLGSHTHVATADEKILAGGTAYITDAGFCGAVDSVIGDAKEGIIASFLDQLPRPHEIPESGEAIVNGVLLEINKSTGKAESIERLSQVV